MSPQDPYKTFEVLARERRVPMSSWVEPPTEPAPVVPKLTEFRCFNRLPLELRNMIWHWTMEPRVVEMTYDLPDGFYTEAKYPVALAVSKESRAEALPSYPLCFGTIFHPATTRFNFNLDTLYLDNSFEEDIPHLLAALNPLELNGLKYLAIDSYFNASDDAAEFRLPLQTAMKHFKGLRELQIVYDIQVLCERTLGCGQEDHPIEIHEVLPAELVLPKLHIESLPDASDTEEFDTWKVKRVKPVYGWRKCPVGIDGDFSDTDSLARWPWESRRHVPGFWGPMDHGDYDYDGYDDEDELDEDEDDDRWNPYIGGPPASGAEDDFDTETDGADELDEAGEVDREGIEDETGEA